MPRRDETKPTRHLGLCYKETSAGGHDVYCLVVQLCSFETVSNEVRSNLTLLELTPIAVVLDEKEGAERKRRRWAVHAAWSKASCKFSMV
jgi:hypothetical protein